MKRTRIALALISLAGAHFSAPAEAQIGGISKGIGIAKKANDVRELRMTDAEEQALGANVSEKIRIRYGVVQDSGVHLYVGLVGTVLAQASTRPELPWKFIVLDTDGVNAFAAPGGYVHITRGALALIKNEAELAGVLGHEIVHITEKHTVRSIQKSSAVQMGASETLSGSAALMDRVVSAVYDNIVERGFGRGDENESDEKGVALANKVGYAPNGLVVFLTSLRERNKESKEKRGLFASHPEMQERLDRITKQIASNKLAAKATVDTRYTKIVTYKPVPITAIATVDPGAAGLTGGEAKPEEKKAEPKAEEKKRGFSLGRMVPTGGGEKKQAQVTGSGGARGADPEKDSKGGPNPAIVAVKISPAEVAAFKTHGGLP
jgi:predicted Zn-dependent protease